MKVFVSSIMVSEFARAKHLLVKWCQNLRVLQNSCQMSEFARASEFVSDVRIRTCFRIRVEK